MAVSRRLGSVPSIACIATLLITGGCSGLEAGATSDECDGLDCAFADAGGRSVTEPPSDPIWASGSAADSSTETPPGSLDGMDPSAPDPTLCYDGLDNDDNGLVDCDDEGCRELPSCRVGHGDRCSALERIDLSFAGCDGSTPTACLTEEVEEFGPVRWIAGDGLHAGGDASQEGGVALTRSFDLTSDRVQLTLGLGDADCTGACVESAGVGFSAARSFADANSVQLEVELLMSGSRHEVMLIVADEVMKRWDVATAEETWRLVVRPSGNVTAERVGDEATTRADVDFQPFRDARLVLHGRNQNRSAPDGNGARIRSVTAEVARCDMPAAWSVTEPVTTIDRSTRATVEPARPNGVSIDVSDGTASFAFVDGGLIWLGGRGGGADSELVLAHDEGMPALAPAANTYMHQVRDPELYRTVEGELLMLFTAEDAGGSTTIGRAQQIAGSHAFEAIINPVAVPDRDGDVSYEMPTVARTDGGVLVMIVRATDVQGTTRLLPLSSNDDGETWSRFIGSTLERLTSRSGSGDLGRFDADEVAHPSLTVHAGAFHLHYAGRRGTRWGLGLMASDDLRYFRDVSAGDTVLGRGSGDAFDRLGPLEGDAAYHDGQVELLYVGTDGAFDRLGRAVRATVAGAGP